MSLPSSEDNTKTTLIRKNTEVETSVQMIIKQIFFQKNNQRPIRLVWWTIPPMEFVKINCDGAFSHHGNKAAAGGVVRNWAGRFVFGFSSGLPNCSTVESELWAIKIGMEAAISRGFNNLIIESDSYTAIQLINDGVQKNHLHHTLVSSIIKLRSKVHHVGWNHIFREINSVADGLAKHGLSLSPELGVKYFEFPPSFILSPLQADYSGTIYSR
ncbi:putative ribonuclease H protein, partial [Mucuna pruriens]